jgi:hypothetical protein
MPNTPHEFAATNHGNLHPRRLFARESAIYAALCFVLQAAGLRFVLPCPWHCTCKVNLVFKSMAMPILARSRF